jgi:uncharacterized protein (TIGR01777 family)
MKTYIFTRKTDIPAPAADVFDWHARAGAIKRLSPPWSPLKVIHKTPGVDTGTQVKLKIKTGPIFSPWDAVHTACEPGRMFRDTQLKGPFHSWNHTHRFIPLGEGRSTLEDHIEFTLPFPFSDIKPANDFIKHDLGRIFRYRHAVTLRDMILHRSGKIKGSLKIAVTGASGLIGSRLVPFLSTGGHQVFTLVRRKPVPENNEIFWDPEKQIIDKDALEGVDVVIHLAGENIGEVRWTDDIKNRLLQSRVMGTTLLSKTLASLNHPPSALLCASAIGYYGDTGSKSFDESGPKGDQYISDMCAQWEMSCDPARQKGIRTVNMRIGVVYSPEGGALSKLLPLFHLGLGARIGSGKQSISWISTEDVLHSIHHLIAKETVSGPVNLVSPEPVSNLEFTNTLADLLKRPAFLRIPESLIRTRFSQMGEEILLSGADIRPGRLLDSGYTFIHKDLRSALSEVLGV